MIYLIDDKKLRQQDFGWTNDKFNSYVGFIKPLYSIEEITQIGKEIYEEQNIVLYHESFLDFTIDSKKALQQREKLLYVAKIKPDFSIAFFSGSQGSRSLNKNVAYLPVSTLYQNLEIIVKHHMQGSFDLNYLLYGKNPGIEEDLYKKLLIANKNIESDSINLTGNNLFIRPASNFIQNAINAAIEAKLFNDVSDEKFSEKINEWLSETEYDNIFLPLCFGPTLSDYNGLRLASFIRCMPTKNQLKKIFIYGYVGLDYLIDHEYFNILKTKNVQLIEYGKKAFQIAGNSNFEELTREELSKEIKKLKLEIPLSYGDSHSIANEWAIHQWTKLVGCDKTDELTKVFENVQSSIYFNYLKTVNPVSESNKISLENLKLNYDGKPKILLIDDEAEKGWFTIMRYLFYEINKINTDYLCINFKQLSPDEIIEKSIKKIFKDDIDIVILDFRLNHSDFETKSSRHITSIQLLKKIKEINPAVQVIAFSATSKIWNFQALQEAGVDGFVFKEGNDNTNQAIISMINNIEICIKKAYFLKPIFKKFKRLKNYSELLSDRFSNDLEKNLSICFEMLEKSFQKSKYLNYSYLQLFLIIEKFIKEESVFERGTNCYVITPTNRYLVLSKSDPIKNDSHYKSAIKFVKINGHYHIKHSIYSWKIDTNFIMSAILLFRYGLETSGGENWSKIYNIRNKKAAHPEVGIVNFSEIKLLSEFLVFIMDPKKINPIEPSRALKEPSIADQVENLKKIWETK